MRERNIEGRVKVKIELDDSLQEEEVIIRCRTLDESIQKLQRVIVEASTQEQKFEFLKGEKQYYVNLTEILFFETNEAGVSAHTVDEIYQVRFKLYELENILPRNFMRVAKSTILNIDLVYSITKNLTASSCVEFLHTHKQVYVSRYYYKQLKERLEEKRMR